MRTPIIKTFWGAAAIGDPISAGDPISLLSEDAEAKILTADERAKIAALDAAPALLDPLRRSVEAASGGLNTVLYDQAGNANYVRLIPRCDYGSLGSAYVAALGTGQLEMFSEGGEDKPYIGIGLYPASNVDGAMVSQPHADPWTVIDYDESVAACAARTIDGGGHTCRLMSVWDWAGVVHNIMARGTQPTGNTDWGRHHSSLHQYGRRVDGALPGTGAGTGRTYAGSGPNEWNHDGSPAGITDLVGNVWEWLMGFKLINGGCHLSADNNDLGSEGGWVDQSFTMPGNSTWSAIDATGASQALKRALIVPAAGISSPTGYMWRNDSGERLPFRGGSWTGAGLAGLAALTLNYARGSRNAHFGFRPAFVP